MRQPAIEPTPQSFAWYVGEDASQAGKVREIFIYDAARVASRELRQAGKLDDPVNLYVRPDQPGARWRRFEARPCGEVLSRG